MNDRMSNILINYLRKNYSDLTVKTSKKYPNTKFFMYKGKVAFDYNSQYNSSLVESEIFSFIDSFFNISESDKKYIIRNWIKGIVNVSPAIIVDDEFVCHIKWSTI